MWRAERLSLKLLWSLAAALGLTSVAFLALFIASYRMRIADERVTASEQVSRLLHVALENAMLKRDLPGLQGIVDRLGKDRGIAGVAITDPNLVVRFADNPLRLNRRLSGEEVGCLGCTAEVVTRREPQTVSARTSDGRELLRSIKPIANQDACRECHGSKDVNPINGVLVIDQEASGIRRDAMTAAALLSGAGLIVVLVGLLSHWFFLRRLVLEPVAMLDEASRTIAGGQLSGRVSMPARRRDEMSELGANFNRMADALEQNLMRIKQQDAFLRALMDTVPDGLRVLDEQKNVVLANRSLARQAGLPLTRIVGRPCYALHGRQSPCPPTLITCPFHAIDADDEPIRYVHRHTRGDGTELHVETTAARVTIETVEGKRAFIVEAIRDLEQQIKYSQEQRLSEIGQLAAGVAHEIYNPLASVQIALQMLLRSNMPASLDPQAAEYINIVEAELEKCISVAKRLLDLSQVPSSSPQLVSLSSLLPEVASLLGYEAQQRGITLALNLGDTPLRVLATDAEMRMIGLNLMQNAFHAMPDGGTLTVSGRISGANVLIDFRDTGVGIEPERMQRIFDPFHSRRADGISGTGLGLTISLAIAKRYQGEITVESEIGAGSTFTVKMPHADAGFEVT